MVHWYFEPGILLSKEGKSGQIHESVHSWLAEGDQTHSWCKEASSHSQCNCPVGCQALLSRETDTCNHCCRLFKKNYCEEKEHGKISWLKIKKSRNGKIKFSLVLLIQPACAIDLRLSLVSVSAYLSRRTLCRLKWRVEIFVYLNLESSTNWIFL